MDNFPEMARECAYKGAEILIRTAGYTRPIQHSWRITNMSNSFCNLMITANVCMCGTDGTFDSMGEGSIINYDGLPLSMPGSNRPNEIITAEVRPDLCREARYYWSVENNIYQFGHRGYVAVEGGVTQSCPYTYMKDMVNGKYKLPWEDHVIYKDGTSCGYPKPTRTYIGDEPNLIELQQQEKEKEKEKEKAAKAEAEDEKKKEAEK